MGVGQTHGRGGGVELEEGDLGVYSSALRRARAWSPRFYSLRSATASGRGSGLSVKPKMKLTV